MRKFQYLSLFIIGLSLALLPAQADAKPHKKHSSRHRVTRHHGAPVSREAAYADIVIDAGTGRILHSSNPTSIRHPASLTKMMTLYLTFQALETRRISMDQRLTVSANASEQSPSKLGLRRGQTIRVEDAILGLVTESANDAAVVLAEGLGGSEENFGQMMTRQARALGMSKTNYDNPSGLPDPDQVTCAADQVRLGHALIAHYPQFYAYFSRDSFTYAGVTHRNHNHLMERYDGMDGIKTGYIRASGFNLVASAKRGDTRLIAAVFGGKSAIARDNQMAQLLDYSFAKAANLPRNAPAAASAPAAQGDDDDSSDGEGDYLTLPAKVAAVFTSNTSVAASDSAWGIQIGSYSDSAVAQQSLASLARSLPQNLGRAQQQVLQPAAGDKDGLYRARFMGLDERNARGTCSYLVRYGQNCQIVLPIKTLNINQGTRVQ